MDSYRATVTSCLIANKKEPIPDDLECIKNKFIKYAGSLTSRQINHSE